MDWATNMVSMMDSQLEKKGPALHGAGQPSHLWHGGQRAGKGPYPVWCSPIAGCP